MTALQAGWGRFLEVVRGLRHWRALVQLRPHDVSTEEGRAAERHRRVFWSAFSGIASRATGLLTMLVAVPLTVHYLGDERYGMWMTITSMIAFFAFADLGLGSGLMTSVAHTHGAGEQDEARRLTSTAFFSLAGLAMVLALTTALVAPFVSWPRLYNVTTAAAAAEAGPATLVFIGCNLLLLPFSVAENVRTGYQSAFSHSLWVGLGNVVSLVSVVLATKLRASLPWLVLAMSGGPVLAGVGSFVAFFFFEQPTLRPALRFATRAESRTLFHAGFLFVVLNVGFLLTFGSDNFVLTQVLGANSVASYSVAARLFSIPLMGLAFLTTPLWPAYGEAIARGDLPWVRRTLGRSVALVMAMAGAMSLLLLVLGNWLITRWVGPELVPVRALLLGLAALAVLQSLGHTISMLLNAAQVLRIQAICVAILAPAAIVLKIVCTKAFGAPGLVWGTLIAYTPILLFLLVWFVPRLLNQLGRHPADADVANSSNGFRPEANPAAVIPPGCD